jgi:hypothetical protein
MKIKCSNSGVAYFCDCFSGYLSGAEYVHPAHFLPFSKLSAIAETVISLPARHSRDEQTILFSALLYSTELVTWETSITAKDDETYKVILANMEYLYRLSQALIQLPHKDNFPSFIINKENSNLENISCVLDSWRDTLTAYSRGYTPIAKEQKIARLQTKIISLQKSNKNPINQLAVWAAEVGSFPNWTTLHPVTETQICLRDYWIEILCSVLGSAKYSVLEYPLKDIQELQEHICTEIPIGSAFSHLLFDAINEVINARKGYSSRAIDLLTPKGLATIAMELETKETDERIKKEFESLAQVKPVAADFSDAKVFAKAMMVWRIKHGT